MSQLFADVRLAFKSLRRRPGYAVIAIATLALGIGANTAVYSLVRSVLLRPLPYGDPAALAMIWKGPHGSDMTWLALPEILSYRRDVPSIESVDMWTDMSANLTGGGDPERLVAAAITPGLFRTLRVTPVRGTGFREVADGGPAPNEVVLSYALWQRRFGGDDAIVGRDVMIDGTPRTVVGVAPPGFALPVEADESRATEIFTPFVIPPNSMAWGDHSYLGVARLKPGASMERATAEMAAAAAAWVRQGFIRPNDPGMGRTAVPIGDFMLGNARQALAIVVAATVLILLIACANVANLTMARADERGRETAVRTALGASRGQLVRQLVTESLVLSLAGAAVGAALAAVVVRAIVSAGPTGLPRIAGASVDAGAFAVAGALAILTTLVFGTWPAVASSRVNLARTITDGGRATTEGRSRVRLRDALTVLQTASAVVLLIAAALLMRSLQRMTSVKLGFRPDSVLTAQVSLPAASYPGTADVVGFYDQLIHRVRALPGVRAAGATRLLPLTGTIGDWSITVEGVTPEPGSNPNGDWQVVSPGYFEAMGATLERGRFFTDADGPDAPIVAVITRAMANKYWPGQDAIGKRYKIGSAGQPWITVVGIVAPIRHNVVTEAARTEMNVPYAQWPVAGASARRTMTLVVRHDRDTRSMANALRAEVRALDPKLPVSEVQTLRAVADRAVAQPRLTAGLVGAFATLALAVAMTGLYGVIALLVARRRQEIGVRLALGAQTRSILAMVLRRGFGLAALGAGIGVVGAMWLTRALQGMLYGVTTLDPVTYAAVPAILLGVAIIACIVPARRAAALDPVTALRDD